MKHYSKKMLSLFLLGFLTKEMEDDIKEHIQQCKECQNALDSEEVQEYLDQFDQAVSLFINSLKKTPECPDLSTLKKYVAKTLEKKEREKIENHIKSCLYCIHQEVLLLIEQNEMVKKAKEFIPFIELIFKPREDRLPVSAEIVFNAKEKKKLVIPSSSLSPVEYTYAGEEDEITQVMDGKDFKIKISMKKEEKEYKIRVNIFDYKKIDVSKFKIILMSEDKTIEEGFFKNDEWEPSKRIGIGEWYLVILPPDRKEIESKISIEDIKLPPDLEKVDFIKKAEELLKEGDYKNALFYLEKRMETSQKEPVVIALISLIHLLWGNISEAEEYKNKFENPDAPEAKLIHALLAMERNDLNEAETLLSNITGSIKSPILRRTAFVSLYRIYRLLKKEKEAEEVLNELKKEMQFVEPEKMERILTEAFPL